MAASLVESLGADFDATAFHDEYREAVVALIERKKTTGDARPAPVAPAPVDDAGDSMTDLLTALQRSVEAAKAASGRVSGGGRGAEPAKPARRSSTKKKAEEDDKPAARKRTRKPA